MGERRISLPGKQYIGNKNRQVLFWENKRVSEGRIVGVFGYNLDIYYYKVL